MLVFLIPVYQTRWATIMTHRIKMHRSMVGAGRGTKGMCFLVTAYSGFYPIRNHLGKGVMLHSCGSYLPQVGLHVADQLQFRSVQFRSPTLVRPGHWLYVHRLSDRIQWMNTNDHHQRKTPHLSNVSNDATAAKRHLSQTKQNASSNQPEENAGSPWSEWNFAGGAGGHTWLSSYCTECWPTNVPRIPPWVCQRKRLM